MTEMKWNILQPHDRCPARVKEAWDYTSTDNSEHYFCYAYDVRVECNYANCPIKEKEKEGEQEK